MRRCDTVVIVINANCFVAFSPASTLRAVAESPTRTERYTLEEQRFTHLCARLLCRITSALIFSKQSARITMCHGNPLIRIISEKLS